MEAPSPAGGVEAVTGRLRRRLRELPQERKSEERARAPEDSSWKPLDALYGGNAVRRQNPSGVRAAVSA